MVAWRIRELIMETLRLISIEQVTPDSEFERDLGCSMDIVEIYMACEEEFGIDIPDEEASELETVGKLTAYVQRKLGL